MTAYNPRNQAPTAIATLEASLAHNLLTLDALYAGMTYREQESSAVDSGIRPVLDVSIVRVPDGSPRLIGRVALPMNTNFPSVSGQKLWLSVSPIGSMTIPAAYLSN